MKFVVEGLTQTVMQTLLLIGKVDVKNKLREIVACCVLIIKASVAKLVQIICRLLI